MEGLRICRTWFRLTQKALPIFSLQYLHRLKETEELEWRKNLYKEKEVHFLKFIKEAKQ